MMSLPLFSLAQMDKWVLPPNEVDFTVTPPTSSVLPNAATSYNVSNAAHDTDGNLLFSIVDNQVFNPSGTNVGTLNSANFFSNTYFSNNILFEIALFPLPGTCDTWCALYLLHGGVSIPGAALAMTEITIMDNGSIVVQQLPNGGVKPYFGGYGGLALSQSAPDAPFGTRTLYVVAGGEVDAYNFTGTGLPSPVTLATYTNFDMALTEVDLSHDGATLAWGNYNNAEIHTLGISPASLTILDFGRKVV
jgi:hypothetical protein